MSKDQKVEVKFDAEIKGLLEGLKSAEEHLGTATEAMRGDLGAMIESFEKFGIAAAGVGLAGLAFEALREAADFCVESVEKTNALARSFEGLQFQTGASMAELKVFSNAMALSGGTTEEFQGVIKGLGRAMRANADVFVANGIATDKTALKQQSLMTTLDRVIAKLMEVHDPGQRAALSIDLLGGRAGSSIPQLVRMHEVIEKLGPDALEKMGASMDGAVDRMSDFEMESGKIDLQLQKMAGEAAKAAEEWVIAYKKMKLSVMELAAEMLKGNGLTGAKHFDREKGEGFQGFQDLGGGRQAKMFNFNQARANEDMGPAPAGAKRNEAGDIEMPGADKSRTAEQLAAAAAAEAQRVLLAKGAAAEIAKAADWVVQEQEKAERSLVAQHQITFNEMIEAAKANAAASLQIAFAKANTDLALERGKPLEIQKTNDELAEAQRKYNGTISELEDKQAEHWVEAQDKASKKVAEILKKLQEDNNQLAKITVAEQMDASKAAIEATRLQVDQAVAMGTMSNAKAVAAKRQTLLQEEAMGLKELQDEQARYAAGTVGYEQAQRKILALKQKTDNEMKKLDNDLALNWKTKMDGMTSGWTDTIAKMVNGQQGFLSGIKSMALEAGLAMEKMFIKMGLDAAENFLISMMVGKTADTSQATGAAAVYAVNAMASVAAIPMVGWAMAPGVGAEAYAAGLAMAGLASAAGGWDRVPSDQVAMIHKNEMVLSAPYAEGLRSIINNYSSGGSAPGGGGGGGGGNTIHIHATDAKSVQRLFAAHSGDLMKVMQAAARRGRYA